MFFVASPLLLLPPPLPRAAAVAAPADNRANGRPLRRRGLPGWPRPGHSISLSLPLPLSFSHFSTYPFRFSQLGLTSYQWRCFSAYELNDSVLFKLISADDLTSV